jgi:hypothetical protein
MESFEEVRDTGKQPQELVPELVAGLSTPLASAGYALQTQSERVITFNRTYRPWYVWIGVVFLFPLGLLFLLYKQQAPITVALEPLESGGTRVQVRGLGEKGVRQAFQQMDLESSAIDTA